MAFDRSNASDELIRNALAGSSDLGFDAARSGRSLESKLASVFSRATEGNIYAATMSFSSREISSAAKAAAARGLNVRILSLEEKSKKVSFVDDPNISHLTYKKTQFITNTRTREQIARNYSEYPHAKAIVTNKEVVFATGNFSSGTTKDYNLQMTFSPNSKIGREIAEATKYLTAEKGFSEFRPSKNSNVVLMGQYAGGGFREYQNIGAAFIRNTKGEVHLASANFNVGGFEAEEVIRQAKQGRKITIYVNTEEGKNEKALGHAREVKRLAGKDFNENITIRYIRNSDSPGKDGSKVAETIEKDASGQGVKSQHANFIGAETKDGRAASQVRTARMHLDPKGARTTEMVVSVADTKDSTDIKQFRDSVIRDLKAMSTVDTYKPTYSSKDEIKEYVGFYTKNLDFFAPKPGSQEVKYSFDPAELVKTRNYALDSTYKPLNAPAGWSPFEASESGAYPGFTENIYRLSELGRTGQWLARDSSSELAELRSFDIQTQKRTSGQKDWTPGAMAYVAGLGAAALNFAFLSANFSEKGYFGYRDGRRFDRGFSGLFIRPNHLRQKNSVGSVASRIMRGPLGTFGLAAFATGAALTLGTLYVDDQAFDRAEGLLSNNSATRQLGERGPIDSFLMRLARRYDSDTTRHMRQYDFSTKDLTYAQDLVSASFDTVSSVTLNIGVYYGITIPMLNLMAEGRDVVMQNLQAQGRTSARMFASGVGLGLSSMGGHLLRNVVIPAMSELPFLDGRFIDTLREIETAWAGGHRSRDVSTWSHNSVYRNVLTSHRAVNKFAAESNVFFRALSDKGLGSLFENILNPRNIISSAAEVGRLVRAFGLDVMLGSSRSHQELVNFLTENLSNLDSAVDEAARAPFQQNITNRLSAFNQGQINRIGGYKSQTLKDIFEARAARDLLLLKETDVLLNQSNVQRLAANLGFSLTGGRDDIRNILEEANSAIRAGTLTDAADLETARNLQIHRAQVNVYENNLVQLNIRLAREVSQKSTFKFTRESANRMVKGLQNSLKNSLGMTPGERLGLRALSGLGARGVFVATSAAVVLNTVVAQAGSATRATVSSQRRSEQILNSALQSAGREKIEVNYSRGLLDFYDNWHPALKPFGQFAAVAYFNTVEPILYGLASARKGLENLFSPTTTSVVKAGPGQQNQILSSARVLDILSGGQSQSFADILSRYQPENLGIGTEAEQRMQAANMLLATSMYAPGPNVGEYSGRVMESYALQLNPMSAIAGTLTASATKLSNLWTFGFTYQGPVMLKAGASFMMPFALQGSNKNTVQEFEPTKLSPSILGGGLLGAAVALSLNSSRRATAITAGIGAAVGYLFGSNAFASIIKSRDKDRGLLGQMFLAENSKFVYAPGNLMESYARIAAVSSLFYVVDRALDYKSWQRGQLFKDLLGEDRAKNLMESRHYQRIVDFTTGLDDSPLQRGARLAYGGTLLTTWAPRRFINFAQTMASQVLINNPQAILLRRAGLSQEQVASIINYSEIGGIRKAAALDLADGVAKENLQDLFNKNFFTRFLFNMDTWGPAKVAEIEDNIYGAFISKRRVKKSRVELAAEHTIASEDESAKKLTNADKEGLSRQALNRRSARFSRITGYLGVAAGLGVIATGLILGWQASRNPDGVTQFVERSQRFLSSLGAGDDSLKGRILEGIGLFAANVLLPFGRQTHAEMGAYLERRGISQAYGHLISKKTTPISAYSIVDQYKKDVSNVFFGQGYFEEAGLFVGSLFGVTFADVSQNENSPSAAFIQPSSGFLSVSKATALVGVKEVASMNDYSRSLSQVLTNSADVYAARRVQRPRRKPAVIGKLFHSGSGIASLGAASKRELQNRYAQTQWLLTNNSGLDAGVYYGFRSKVEGLKDGPITFKYLARAQADWGIFTAVDGNLKVSDNNFSQFSALSNALRRFSANFSELDSSAEVTYDPIDNTPKGKNPDFFGFNALFSPSNLVNPETIVMGGLAVLSLGLGVVAAGVNAYRKAAKSIAVGSLANLLATPGVTDETRQKALDIAKNPAVDVARETARNAADILDGKQIEFDRVTTYGVDAVDDGLYQLKAANDKKAFARHHKGNVFWLIASGDNLYTYGDSNVMGYDAAHGQHSNDYKKNEAKASAARAGFKGLALNIGFLSTSINTMGTIGKIVSFNRIEDTSISVRASKASEVVSHMKNLAVSFEAAKLEFSSKITAIQQDVVSTLARLDAGEITESVANERLRALVGYNLEEVRGMRIGQNGGIVIESLTANQSGVDSLMRQYEQGRQGIETARTHFFGGGGASVKLTGLQAHELNALRLLERLQVEISKELAGTGASTEQIDSILERASRSDLVALKTGSAAAGDDLIIQRALQDIDLDSSMDNQTIERILFRNDTGTSLFERLKTASGEIFDGDVMTKFGARLIKDPVGTMLTMAGQRFFIGGPQAWGNAFYRQAFGFAAYVARADKNLLFSALGRTFGLMSPEEFIQARTRAREEKRLNALFNKAIERGDEEFLRAQAQIEKNMGIAPGTLTTLDIMDDTFSDHWRAAMQTSAGVDVKAGTILDEMFNSRGAIEGSRHSAYGLLNMVYYGGWASFTLLHNTIGKPIMLGLTVGAFTGKAQEASEFLYGLGIASSYNPARGVDQRFSREERDQALRNAMGGTGAFVTAGLTTGAMVGVETVFTARATGAAMAAARTSEAVAAATASRTGIISSMTTRAITALTITGVAAIAGLSFLSLGLAFLLGGVGGVLTYGVLTAGSLAFGGAAANLGWTGIAAAVGAGIAVDQVMEHTGAKNAINNWAEKNLYPSLAHVVDKGNIFGKGIEAAYNTLQSTADYMFKPRNIPQHKKGWWEKYVSDNLRHFLSSIGNTTKNYMFYDPEAKLGTSASMNPMYYATAYNLGSMFSLAEGSPLWFGNREDLVNKSIASQELAMKGPSSNVMHKFMHSSWFGDENPATTIMTSANQTKYRASFWNSFGNLSTLGEASMVQLGRRSLDTQFIFQKLLNRKDVWGVDTLNRPVQYSGYAESYREEMEKNGADNVTYTGNWYKYQRSRPENFSNRAAELLGSVVAMAGMVAGLGLAAYGAYRGGRAIYSAVSSGISSFFSAFSRTSPRRPPPGPGGGGGPGGGSPPPGSGPGGGGGGGGPKPSAPSDPMPSLFEDVERFGRQASPEDSESLLRSLIDLDRRLGQEHVVTTTRSEMQKYSISPKPSPDDTVQERARIRDAEEHAQPRTVEDVVKKFGASSVEELRLMRNGEDLIRAMHKGDTEEHAQPQTVKEKRILEVRRGDVYWRTVKQKPRGAVRLAVGKYSRITVDISADVLRHFVKMGKESPNAEVSSFFLGEFYMTRKGFYFHITGYEDKVQEKPLGEAFIRAKNRAQDDGTKLLGLFHSRPGQGVFYQDYDISQHRWLFDNGNQIGIVIDPKINQGGVFYNDIFSKDYDDFPKILFSTESFNPNKGQNKPKGGRPGFIAIPGSRDTSATSPGAVTQKDITNLKIATRTSMGFGGLMLAANVYSFANAKDKAEKRQSAFNIVSSGGELTTSGLASAAAAAKNYGAAAGLAKASFGFGLLALAPDAYTAVAGETQKEKQTATGSVISGLAMMGLTGLAAVGLAAAGIAALPLTLTILGIGVVGGFGYSMLNDRYQLNRKIGSAVTSTFEFFFGKPANAAEINPESFYKSRQLANAETEARRRAERERERGFLGFNAITRSVKNFARSLWNKATSTIKEVFSDNRFPGDYVQPLTKYKANDGVGYFPGHASHYHEGLDMGAHKGQPVYAARNGVVSWTTPKWGNQGGAIAIQNIVGAKEFVVYGHLNRENMAVKSGQSVKAGDVIGYVDTDHLHLEIWEKGTYKKGTPLQPSEVMNNWEKEAKEKRNKALADGSLPGTYSAKSVPEDPQMRTPGKQMKTVFDRVNQYDEIIRAASKKYGVPESLIKGIIATESGGNPEAVSPVGASGLMQLMPGTAKWLGVENSRDPQQNIEGGVKYIAMMLKQQNGDVKDALSAYNWGPGNLARAKKNKTSLPKETREYSLKVLNYQGKFKAITADSVSLNNPPVKPASNVDVKTGQPRQVKIEIKRVATFEHVSDKPAQVDNQNNPAKKQKPTSVAAQYDESISRLLLTATYPDGERWTPLFDDHHAFTPVEYSGLDNYIFHHES